MRLPIKPLIAILYLWFALWMSAIPSIAAISCMKWNTGTFFRIADEEDVSRCLKGGANANARDKYGETPLHWAAIHTKTSAVVTALVEAGAKINARNEDGDTPLHHAVSHKYPAVVRALLKAEADVNARDKNGFTPLHRAAAAGGGRQGAILGANFRARTIGLKTSLAALKDGHSPAEAKRKGRLAETAYKQAARKRIFKEIDGGNPAVVTALLDAGSNPNTRDKNKRTSLHWAAEYSIPAIVAALLEAGASPTAKDKKSNTAWDLAKENPSLKGTDVYWQLNEARFKTPSPRKQKEKLGSGKLYTF
ncbi:MAG: ankyrin repeat domain-containing protein [Nitrospinae bacterium]|nr:ankyrin repeat domain-containing protein [Nitrospinota bacterium]